MTPPDPPRVIATLDQLSTWIDGRIAEYRRLQTTRQYKDDERELDRYAGFSLVIDELTELKSRLRAVLDPPAPTECDCGHDSIKATTATVGGNHSDSCAAAPLRAPTREWQPIESYDPSTHPLDVLVYVDGTVGSGVGEARLHGEEGWWWAGNDPTDAHGNRIYPSYWMPLPAPPARREP